MPCSCCAPVESEAFLIRGMHGLGDCLHQRAIVREYMRRGRVWLESSWVAPYHDLIGEGLHVIRRETTLRTQAKNADREAGSFSKVKPPRNARRVDVHYSGEDVMRTGSVLAAMSATSRCPVGDFRLPVPAEWRESAREWLATAGWDFVKPLMVYRPLVERNEYQTGRTRNPDPAAYAELFRSIRDRYFVVSVADIQPGAEWLVGDPLPSDAAAHRGELEFERLAGLFWAADLVFCSPGFAVILAQAVETPAVCVFGGYERANSFGSAGTLAIEPIAPCGCWRSGHDCRKEIDLPTARKRIEEFLCQD